MTTIFPDIRSVAAIPGVYAPQHDSLLLIEAMQRCSVVERRSVLDLCCGSGVVAIAAAQLGARTVTAFDVSERAVRCTRRNAEVASVSVDARRGTHADALACGPYDLVVANPPYVPADAGAQHETLPPGSGPAHACNAGSDGRAVLDPLCCAAADLLSEQGTLLLVQSEFADPGRSLHMLRRRRLYADIVMTQIIPFGPVLAARASWMEESGLLPVGRREEEIVVIHAEKP